MVKEGREDQRNNEGGGKEVKKKKLNRDKMMCDFASEGERWIQ